MKKSLKKSMIISASILLVITLILVGITYAYFRTRVIGNTDTALSKDITVKKLEIEYSDGNSNFVSGQIGVGYKSTKTFTVTNNGDAESCFSIVIDSMTNTFQRNQDWVYKLSYPSTYENSPERTSGFIAVGTHQVLMPKSCVDAGDSKTFYLEVEYMNLPDVNQSSDMGRMLELRVNIANEVVTWDSPGAPSWEADDAVSLIEAIQRDNSTILTTDASGKVTAPTIPTNALATGNAYTAGEIISVEDDYGISYVFRGNPTNNYVTYSNMCWRILRIQGDGTIKLMLTDKDNACSASTSDVFTDKSHIGYISAWFYNSGWYDDSIYSGFKDNPVFQAADEFSRKINKHLLTVTDWCMDGAKAYGSSTWDSYSYSRIYTSKEYSLKCNREGLDGINARRWNKYTHALSDMYVGVITIDEAILGGVNLSKATKSYLSSTTGYLTMTPSWLYNGNEIRYHKIKVNNSTNKTSTVGELVGGFYDYFIPVVALKNDVIIKSGDGTNSNPYYVY